MKRPFVLSLAALTVFPLIPATAASGGPPQADTRIVFSRNDISNHDIYSMTSTGANVVAMTNTPGVQDLSPAGSPDGKRIAFRRAGAGPDQLWVMNADGSGVTVVPGSGRVGDPSWSPDGKQLVYECREQIWPYVGHICVRDVAGGGFQLLSSAAGASDGAPTWSPDGTRIAWHRVMNGYSHLLVLTLKGLSLNALTPPTPGRHDSYPDWSPDGDQIVFSRFQNGSGLGSSLYRVPATGGATTLVIAGPPIVDDTYLTQPAWSPDGTTIAYAAMDDDEGWGNIWTITPDGKDNTQLTFGRMTDMSPDWMVA